MSLIDERTKLAIEEINARLKLAKIGVTVRARGKGNRLCVRGTFPPRPGKIAGGQDDIPLGIYTNPAGLKAAEKAAKKIGTQLADGVFNWAEWQPTSQTENDPKVEAPSVGEWLKRFEADYFNRRKRNPKSETTWRGDYLQPFKQLPQNAPLTIELLHECIISTGELKLRANLGQG